MILPASVFAMGGIGNSQVSDPERAFTKEGVIASGGLAMSADTPARRRHDPEEFHQLLVKFDFHIASAEEYGRARALAAETISPHIASESTLRRVQQTTQAAVFINRHAGKIVGILGIIPLQPAGVAAVQRHLFCPRDPSNEFLCLPNDRFAGLYGWGFSALTRKVAAQALAASKALRDHFFEVPFFSRAATPAGAKALLGRLGYTPYPDAPDDLLWNPALSPQERAA
jgi:hypothetical protein